MEQALQPLNNSISRLSDGIDLLSDRVDVLSDRAGVLSGAINSYVGSVSQAARRSAIVSGQVVGLSLCDAPIKILYFLRHTTGRQVVALVMALLGNFKLCLLLMVLIQHLHRQVTITL